MKAAILQKIGAPLIIEDIEIPALDIGQVLVQFYASSICGAQINEILGTRGPDPYLPHLLGHEGCGIVKNIGSDVKYVKPGDLVVAHWRKGQGIEASCPQYKWGGGYIGGGRITTFAEQAIISENRLTVIPDDIPYDVAALMGCAVTTGLGVIFNDAKVKPGQRVAVIGCGGVGLMAIQGARLAGANGIYAFDISDTKILMAQDFGADGSCNLRDDPDGIHYLNGADVIIETTGRSNLIARAYDYVAPGGKVIMVGQPRYYEDLFLMQFGKNFKGKTIMDSEGGGTNPNTDIPKYLDYYRSGELKLKELITHRFPLEQINEAVQIMREGNCGRVMLEMGC